MLRQGAWIAAWVIWMGVLTVLTIGKRMGVTMRALATALCLGLLPVSVMAAAPQAGDGLAAPFQSIDGGTLDIAQWAGHPVLVVNTASMCGYTPQYQGLQALYDTYRSRGLVVLAVPSDDFNQEYASASEVKTFCHVNYDLTLPMTDITHVLGAQAHPFYKWVEAQTGFAPRWNFNKILIAPDGHVAATWREGTDPMQLDLRRTVETYLR